jgi:FkbM family methyltransferase
MAWVQYTRNFEDVMLRRALQGIERGCYLDVGASHPVVDSNTYALYQRGWRGIAVEPQPQFAAAWAQARPEDVFVGAAAGAGSGETELHTPRRFGQSATTHGASLARYRRMGLETAAQRVRLTTLNAVLEELLGGRTLHLLSLDVEGGEGAAFAGLDLGRFRPWLMIVEVTLPGSPELAPCDWEPGLVGAGYETAYFDGVNRFYLAREHAALKRHFALPPNVWDDFVSHRPGNVPKP